MQTATDQSYSNNRANKKDQLLLPDIQLNNPYHTRGWSENQRAYNKKIQELLKEKYDKNPLNQQAIKIKYLKSHCNNIIRLN